jgi:hypothetical protein
VSATLLICLKIQGKLLGRDGVEDIAGLEDWLACGSRSHTCVEQGQQNRGKAGSHSSKKSVGIPVKPTGLLSIKNIRHGLGWEPDRFVYRAGPVPPGTDRIGPVPTGFANPGVELLLGL